MSFVVKAVWVVIAVVILFGVNGCSFDKGKKEFAADKGSVTATQEDVQDIVSEVVTINVSNTKQIIDGFGASGAWWAQEIGGWSDANRRKIVDLLFDREKGIGLSIYRYNIGAGSNDGLYIQDPWRRTEGFEVERKVYDWSKDANAVWVLKRANEMGVENIIAFVNSPPGRMTKSGFANGNKGGTSNLRQDMYEEYAQYLIDIVKHLKEEEGIRLGWISPVNEPNVKWSFNNGQEGCHYEPDEVKEVIKALLKKIEEENVDIKVSAPEVGEWAGVLSYASALFEDKEINERIDCFSGHSYWSTMDAKETFKKIFTKRYPGKKIWMSEWTEMKNGRDYGMDSALYMALKIHEDLTVLEANSWQYWIAVSSYDYRDGLIYTKQGTEIIEDTKRLWVLGNYSRFVRPGYYRVETNTENQNLKMTAFLDKHKERLVLVAVNVSEHAVRTELLVNGEITCKNVRIYETSEKNNLTKVYSGNFKTKITIQPKSVTTLVME